MTTYNLNCFDMGLPPTVKAGDKLVYTGGYIEGAEVYQLYEDPQRGLRMHRINNAEAHEAIEMAQQASLDATHAQAAGRWGY